MKLLIIRHPQTEALKNRIIYGRTASPLTKEGAESISWAAKLLKDKDLAALYCSPQERAKLLAEGIAKEHPGLELRIDERICELHCGIYEQLTFEEAVALDAEDANKFLYEFGFHRPRGGENFEDVKARTGPFLQDLAETAEKEGYGERPIAVVSHAMAIRSMISHMTGFGLNDIWHIEIQPTGILEFDYQPEHKFGRLISMTGPASLI
ncbi:MAG: histidine phosphatase family protein [Firmicutes bacterium]|nr:histidine phosphatase family protein [Bacillota bacterium]